MIDSKGTSTEEVVLPEKQRTFRMTTVGRKEHTTEVEEIKQEGNKERHKHRNKDRNIRRKEGRKEGKGGEGGGCL